MGILVTILIWSIVSIIGVTGIIFLFIEKENRVMASFVTWFTITFVIGIFLIDLISNPVILSFIFAMVIAMLGNKDK